MAPVLRPKWALGLLAAAALAPAPAVLAHDHFTADPARPGNAAAAVRADGPAGRSAGQAGAHPNRSAGPADSAEAPPRTPRAADTDADADADADTDTDAADTGGRPPASSAVHNPGSPPQAGPPAAVTPPGTHPGGSGVRVGALGTGILLVGLGLGFFGLRLRWR